MKVNIWRFILARIELIISLRYFLTYSHTAGQKERCDPLLLLQGIAKHPSSYNSEAHTTGASIHFLLLMKTQNLAIPEVHQVEANTSFLSKACFFYVILSFF